MNKETREFIYWLMDNCQLITDEDTGKNVLWRYESEDYSVDKLFEIYKDSINVNLDLKNKIMKQTAVEWLVDYIENQNKYGYEFHPKYAEHIVQQAKEIEKQQQGFSEEEVLVLLHKRDKHNMDNPNTFNGWLTPKEWFEQFKKK